MSCRTIACMMSLAVATACVSAPREPAPAPAGGAPPAAAPAPGAAPPGAADVWYTDPWSLGYDRPGATGGTFNYANSFGPATLDPFANYQRAIGFLGVTYDGLLGQRLAPGKSGLAADVFCRLCESWEVKSDKTTYTFKLRQSVKFHDGQSFSSEDVKFSLEKAIDPKTGYEFRSLFSDIDKVEAPDTNTVIVTTKKPNADFIRALGGGVLSMVPKHAYDSGKDLAKTVIGTGPFKMQSFNQDTEFVGVKNTDFWVPGRPVLDRVVGHSIPDYTTRQSAFLTKQLDVITADNLTQIRPLLGTAPGVKSEAFAVDLAPVLWLNYTQKPFSDKRVRQAMHLAIDRDEMNQQLTEGLGVKYTVPGSPPAWQPLTITQEELAKLPGFRRPKDQDMAEARRLLAEAGYPDGFKTTSMHQAGSTHNPEQNEAAAGQLKKIGVEVTLQPLEPGVVNKRQSDCTYDMLLRPSGGSTSMPNRSYGLWLTGGSENFCKFSNAEYDKLYLEQSQELDHVKRWQIVKKLQTILLGELPVIPLSDRAPYAAWQPYLHNWRNYGHTWTFPFYPIAELIWVEKG